MTSEQEQKAKVRLLEDLRAASSRGDRGEIRRLRSEFYNIYAPKARKEGDQVTLLLMALVEEFDKEGDEDSAAFFNLLLVLRWSRLMQTASRDFFLPLVVPMVQGVKDAVLELQRRKEYE